jgi:hypothetical protein
MAMASSASISSPPELNQLLLVLRRVHGWVRDGGFGRKSDESTKLHGRNTR